jgi:2-keto-4-pentenoate hydratase
MPLTSDDIRSAAISLAGARRHAEALGGFPGELPQSLDDAYAIQAEATRRWDRKIAGWKAGRLTGEWEERFGVNRFIGPIFADTVQHAKAYETLPFPAINGGSAAIESEIIARLGRAVEPIAQDWTADTARALVDSIHIGIEVAGCAVPGIGALGPLASIAAFENNMGLIVGPAIADWPASGEDRYSCITVLHGVSDFPGTTVGLPGGIHESTAFALNTAARLGFSLPKGCWISTGAITGVHSVTIGQKATATFPGHSALSCAVIAAVPD